MPGAAGVVEQSAPSGLCIRRMEPTMPDDERTGPVPDRRTASLPRSGREIARAGLLLGAIALLAGIFWAASESLMPYLVGLLFVYILLPPVRWIDRHLPLPAKL